MIFNMIKFNMIKSTVEKPENSSFRKSDLITVAVSVDEKNSISSEEKG